MPNTSFADVMRGWERLAEKVLANQADLPHLEAYRAQLEVEITGAKVANARQLTLQAEAAQATRDLEGFLERGNDLATRMRSGIRSRYGNRAEKLKDFGLRPLRSRKTKKEESEKQEEEEEKPAPSTATTDGNP